MGGVGRHPVLGVRSDDPVLSVVAPIGMAAAVGTALVVDMVTPSHVGAMRTLRDIHEDGPLVSELSPGRPGIALLAGGGLEPAQAAQAVARLAGRWPAVVVRVDNGDEWPFPVVPVQPLFPGRLAPVTAARHGVWQPVAGGADPPGPGPVLPRLPGRLVRSLLDGRMPRRGRWVGAWRPVWEMPWA